MALMDSLFFAGWKSALLDIDSDGSKAVSDLPFEMG